jgi:hypothetical protein
MEQWNNANEVNGMLMFQPPSDVQRLRELFIQIKDKWPEDYIEVEEAIQLFAKYEKALIQEKDSYRKLYEESFKYSWPQPILMSKEHCDPAALVGNWIPYNCAYNLTKSTSSSEK